MYTNSICSVYRFALLPVCCGVLFTGPASGTVPPKMCLEAGVTTNTTQTLIFPSSVHVACWYRFDTSNLNVLTVDNPAEFRLGPAQMRDVTLTLRADQPGSTTGAEFREEYRQDDELYQDPMGIAFITVIGPGGGMCGSPRPPGCVPGGECSWFTPECCDHGGTNGGPPPSPPPPPRPVAFPSRGLAAGGTDLYLVPGGALVQANSVNGSWDVLGSGTEWGGSTAMTALGNYLYIDQAPYLVRASPINGNWNVTSTILLQKPR